MNEQDKPAQVSPIETLNRKIDAVIDHAASNFGNLDKRLDSLGSVMSSLNSRMESNEAIIDTLATEEKPVDRAALYAALAAAQKEIKNADANVENEYLKNKYADLASCLNAVRGPLSENGIALIQLTEDPGSGVLGIRTILAHESGQTLEDVITMAPPKMDPQGVGSCRTYMRRYSLMAICGIAGALDDDAEGTVARITPSEAEKILYEADQLFNEHADDAIQHMLNKVFSESGATAIGEIPAGEMDTAINFLNNFKKAREIKLAAEKKKKEAAAKKAKAEAK